MGTPSGFFVIGFIAIVVCVFMGVFNLRRVDTKSAKKTDSVFSASTFVWATLTPAQRKKLSEMDLLLAQELWIEKNVSPESLKGSSPEDILVALANRGEIRFGKGVSKRYASPFDLMEAEEVMEKLKAEEEPPTSEPLALETVKTGTDVLPEKQAKGKRKTYRVATKGTVSIKKNKSKGATRIIYHVKEQGRFKPASALKTMEEPPRADNPEGEDNQGSENPAKDN